MLSNTDGTRAIHQKQLGLTMVELLVALVISLLISLAAISALTVTRRGFSTVDASSQLRDNGRFSADLIQRVAVQGGFKDAFYAAKPPTAAEIAANVAPNVSGFDNALSSSSDPLNVSTSRTAGSLGDGSDVLILRYQTAESFPGSGVSDKSMINCAGSSSTSIPISRNDRVPSIFHVAESPSGSGELALMCTYQNPTTGNWDTQPIVQGVEVFQVLYGVDGVTTAANTEFVGTPLAVADAYLRADQMTVTGTGGAVKTNNNWRRVRSLRIGMVLRGPPNSAQDKVTRRLYPFGSGKSSATGAEGSALSSNDDINTKFDAPADGRLRQVLSFTVHLRNEQSL
jgi:type IV pilus assembly protein PilW